MQESAIMNINQAVKKLPHNVKVILIQDRHPDMPQDEIVSNAANPKSQVLRQALAYHGFLV
ncbi:hypothetical protein [Vibrio phage vB_VpP_WS0699]